MWLVTSSQYGMSILLLSASACDSPDSTLFPPIMLSVSIHLSQSLPAQLLTNQFFINNESNTYLHCTKCCSTATRCGFYFYF